MVTHTDTHTHVEKKPNVQKSWHIAFFPHSIGLFFPLSLISRTKHREKTKQKKYYSHEIVCFLCELNIVFCLQIFKSLPIAPMFFLQCLHCVCNALQCKWWFWYAYAHAHIQWFSFWLNHRHCIHSRVCVCVSLWYMAFINNHSW